MATKNEIEDLFNCPICVEILENPKYLPCLHTFCEKCIKSLMESRKSKINCPICRYEIEKPSHDISAEEWANSLPKNHQLLTFQNICENFLEPKILCDSCSKNDKKSYANVRCTECKDNLCDNCNNLIHRMKELVSHTIVNKPENTAKETPLTSDFETCVVHVGNRIEVYCFDHDQLGCRFCLTTKHKDCKTVLALIVDEEIENKLEAPTKSFRRMKGRRVSVSRMEVRQKVLRGIPIDFTKSICKEILVAVLDIRNVFGFAYSFKHDWSKVICNNWDAFESGPMLMNVPASLLFRQDKSLKAIGYQAQEEKDHGDVNNRYYFHQVATVFEAKKVCYDRDV